MQCRPWGSPVLAQEVGERLNAREVLSGLFGLGVKAQPVLLLDGHAQLERVDRVEPKPLLEQGRARVDVRHGELLELEGVDDELLQLAFESIRGLHGVSKASSKK